MADVLQRAVTAPLTATALGPLVHAVRERTQPGSAVSAQLAELLGLELDPATGDVADPLGELLLELFYDTLDATQVLTLPPAKAVRVLVLHQRALAYAASGGAVDDSEVTIAEGSRPTTGRITAGDGRPTTALASPTASPAPAAVSGFASFTPGGGRWAAQGEGVAFFERALASITRNDTQLARAGMLPPDFAQLDSAAEQDAARAAAAARRASMAESYLSAREAERLAVHANKFGFLAHYDLYATAFTTPQPSRPVTVNAAIESPLPARPLAEAQQVSGGGASAGAASAVAAAAGSVRSEGVSADDAHVANIVAPAAAPATASPAPNRVAAAAAKK
jgi:hypothetical protein